MCDAAAILLERSSRKTTRGVHKFVLCNGVWLLYSLPVASTLTSPVSKTDVAEFWNAEPCGTRYLGEKSAFEEHARKRYELEPHIPDFAGFQSARGLRVLEIGVGIGADYEQWLKAGALATGVDLSILSLRVARLRCEAAGLKPDLHQADAEDLPFPSGSFDFVYSYGVMHHSPNTAACIEEAWRVLKPGGQLRIMLYQHPSLTGIMLWLRFGLWRGQSIRRCVFEKLESPGTQTFTRSEMLTLMRAFENVRIEQVFSPGDLLLNEPSSRFRGKVYRALWKLFPRGLVRACCRRWALFALISAEKPVADSLSTHCANLDTNQATVLHV
jgi:ubiquinone/menaquinone biosynthesis C-methylase UbiE